MLSDATGTYRILIDNQNKEDTQKYLHSKKINYKNITLKPLLENHRDCNRMWQPHAKQTGLL